MTAIAAKRTVSFVGRMTENGRTATVGDQTEPGHCGLSVPPQFASKRPFKIDLLDPASAQSLLLRRVIAVR